MTQISSYRLAQLEQELSPAIRSTLQAVAEALDGGAPDGVRITDRSDEELRLRVGPLAVFFRGAFALRHTAVVQYGHIVGQADGRQLCEVDGEWTVEHASSLPHYLRAKYDNVLGRALQHVIKSVAEKHGDAVRLIEGVVQPPVHILAEDPNVW